MRRKNKSHTLALYWGLELQKLDGGAKARRSILGIAGALVPGASLGRSMGLYWQRHGDDREEGEDDDGELHGD